MLEWRTVTVAHQIVDQASVTLLDLGTDLSSALKSLLTLGLHPGGKQHIGI